MAKRFEMLRRVEAGDVCPSVAETRKPDFAQAFVPRSRALEEAAESLPAGIISRHLSLYLIPLPSEELTRKNKIDFETVKRTKPGNA